MYLPSVSTTGRFQALVSSKMCMIFSIGMSLTMRAEGETMKRETRKRSYSSGRNMMLRMLSTSTMPSSTPSVLTTGNMLRELLAMASLTTSPRLISGRTAMKSVSITLPTFMSVSTALSLWCVRSSPFWAKRMV